MAAFARLLRRRSADNDRPQVGVIADRMQRTVAARAGFLEAAVGQFDDWRGAAVAVNAGGIACNKGHYAIA